jgi:uncharacterized protein YndB with AHSA1/START domain
MTDELRLERVIDAPPDVVFDAFTTDGGQRSVARDEFEPLTAS